MQSWLCAAIFLFCLFFPPGVLAQVKINEFLVDPNPEWVEFYNSSDSAEYLKSYYLDDDLNFTDDTGSSAIKSLATLVISNATFPYISFSSFLNNNGDYVVIFDPAGNLVDSYQYTSSPGENTSVGRYPDNSGSFAPLLATTQGAPNSAQTTPSPTLAPTPEPTAAPTPTPSPTPTKTPTPKPTPKPTRTQVPVEEPVSEGPVNSPEVLSLVAEETPIATEAAYQTGFNIPLPAIFLMGGGGALVIAAGVLFARQRHTKYGNVNGNEIRQ